MRIHILLIAAIVLATALLAGEATISPRFQTVYILQMSNGLDQHLANRLTSGRVLWVVLEPKNADAVLTDTLDDSFWDWLSQAYPPPPTAKETNRNPGAKKDGQPASNRPGMVFLVDPRARVVLWSAWDYPKNTTAVEVNHSAERIANQLKISLGKK